MLIAALLLLLLLLLVTTLCNEEDDEDAAAVPLLLPKGKLNELGEAFTAEVFLVWVSVSLPLRLSVMEGRTPTLDLL